MSQRGRGGYNDNDTNSDTRSAEIMLEMVRRDPEAFQSTVKSLWSERSVTGEELERFKRKLRREVETRLDQDAVHIDEMIQNFRRDMELKVVVWIGGAALAAITVLGALITYLDLLSKR